MEKHHTTTDDLSENQSKYFEMCRGILAVIVVIAHTIQIFNQDTHSLAYRLTSTLAGSAVLGFFAISGFFIHQSIYRNERINKKFLWKNFFQARINRLIPPYMLSLTMTLGLWYIAPFVFESKSHEFVTATNRTGFYLDGFFRSLFFISNFTGPALSANGALWSLTYEVWYYALACIFWLARKNQILYIPSTILLIGLTILDVWFFILGAIWISGLVVSILYSNNQTKKLNINLITWLLVLILFIVLAAPINLFGKFSIIFRITFGIWSAIHLNNKLLSKNPKIIPIFQKIGQFSYTLYIIHFPILLFFYGISRGQSIIAFFSTLIIAYILGPIIEKQKIIK